MSEGQDADLTARLDALLSGATIHGVDAVSNPLAPDEAMYVHLELVGRRTVEFAVTNRDGIAIEEVEP